jgi:hypothetical protein
MTLSVLFDQIGSRDIHWLKIDVEGFERQVLDGWGESNARPWIVVVESTLPMTTIETHEKWEKLLFDKQYSSIYFDGLNRYYLSAEHQDLYHFFASPPNVFDGFTLNGTASTSIHTVIQKRCEEKLELNRVMFDKQSFEKEQLIVQQQATIVILGEEYHEREKSFTLEIEILKEAKQGIEEKRLQEEKQYIWNEQSLNTELKILQDRVYQIQLEKEQLIIQQQETITTLGEEYHEREKSLLLENNQLNIDLNHKNDLIISQLSTIVEREKEFSAEIHQIRLEKYTLELSNKDILLHLSNVQDLESQLHTELAISEQLVYDLSQELIQLRGSISWKLTSPIRMIESLFMPTKPNHQHKPLAVVDDTCVNHVATLMDEPLIITEAIENLKPSCEETNMPSSTIIAAISFEELLTYNDTDFVHCAYLTLLGRSPDSEGMSYYTRTLRAGTAKIAIIDQIVSSSEGQRYSVNIKGLHSRLSQYRWGKIPIIGVLFRKDSMVQEIRQLESSIYLLKQEMNHRFNVVEQQVKQISYNATSSSSTQITEPFSFATENYHDLTYLSPTARKIYIMLKNLQGKK